MKFIPGILLVGLLSQFPALSQSEIQFNINFGANPPPHALGVPTSGAILTDNSFYAAIYLDGSEPSSGWILEQSGESNFTPIFQFGNPVFAGYGPPLGGTAWSYENTWELTESQIGNLLQGRWYAQITFGAESYLGQITPVPEPGIDGIFLGGGILIFCCFRKNSQWPRYLYLTT
ncbi:MAG TPA: hypothetical protein VFM25_10855 [Verrucomicrobiae bacterium]|jgi:hypothetical protein|nr:hypothetical protein [Verrucomicrobiae bacterium]